MAGDPLFWSHRNLKFLSKGNVGAQTETEIFCCLSLSRAIEDLSCSHLSSQGSQATRCGCFHLYVVKAQPASYSHQIQRPFECSRETSCSCPLALFPPCITVSSEAMANITSCHLRRPMLETLAPNSQEHRSLCIQVVKGYLTQCVPSCAV